MQHIPTWARIRQAGAGGAYLERAAVSVRRCQVNRPVLSTRGPPRQSKNYVWRHQRHLRAGVVIVSRKVIVYRAAHDAELGDDRYPPRRPQREALLSSGLVSPCTVGARRVHRIVRPDRGKSSCAAATQPHGGSLERRMHGQQGTKGTKVGNSAALVGVGARGPTTGK